MPREFGYAFQGQHGRRWDELYPSQQAVVPKARFVACTDFSAPGNTTATVIETYAEPIEVEGAELNSTALVVEIKGNIGALGAYATTRTTVHALELDGHWRWLMFPDDVAAYKAGRCPG